MISLDKAKSLIRNNKNSSKKISLKEERIIIVFLEWIKILLKNKLDKPTEN